MSSRRQAVKCPLPGVETAGDGEGQGPQPLWGSPAAGGPSGVVPGSCPTAVLRLRPGKGHGGVRAGSSWRSEAPCALHGSRGEGGLVCAIELAHGFFRKDCFLIQQL